ncbi:MULTISPECIES: tail protein X [Vibrio]|uniref:Phage Tail Protein X n=2 Tax=Vibrio TaxID=662 RepID=A0A1R4LK82_VIBR1|nr:MULTISPECIES: tail protein X [Vibrio]KUI98976.1 tail X family protein [Vibrio sp. MEBiC08052]MDW6093129.1 tail protein X [Vibrio rhizosphaerae]WNJ94984.1 tail protein X [Vibrio ruber]SJN56992.1 Phage Tail Protein X [Vibrio ruber DSM 16370]
MRTVVSRDGDLVPQLLWLSLGRDDDEAEEALYMVNPGLALYGPVLPAGVEIKLPILPEPVPTRVMNIWD